MKRKKTISSISLSVLFLASLYLYGRGFFYPADNFIKNSLAGLFLSNRVSSRISLVAVPPDFHHKDKEPRLISAIKALHAKEPRLIAIAFPVSDYFVSRTRGYRELIYPVVFRGRKRKQGRSGIFTAERSITPFAERNDVRTAHINAALSKGYFIIPSGIEYKNRHFYAMPVSIASVYLNRSEPDIAGREGLIFAHRGIPRGVNIAGLGTPESVFPAEGTPHFYIIGDKAFLPAVFNPAKTIILNNIISSLPRRVPAVGIFVFAAAFFIYLSRHKLDTRKRLLVAGAFLFVYILLGCILFFKRYTYLDIFGPIFSILFILFIPSGWLIYLKDRLDTGIIYRKGKEADSKKIDSVYRIFPIHKDVVALYIGDASREGTGDVIYKNLDDPALRLEPDAFLSRANEELLRIGKDTFLSSMYAVVDIKAKNIKFSQAAFNPFVVYKERKRDILEVNQADTMPLGVIQNPRFYLEEIRLDNGDIIFIYNSNLYRADRNGSSGQDLTFAIKANAGLYKHRSASEIAKFLEKEICGDKEVWEKGDIILIVMKIT